MPPANFHQEYQKNAVSTSNQGKLILMMYDGAIKFTRMALACVERNDISGKSLYVRKTQDIVNELSLALNLDKGGEIATHLESLYRYTLNQLTLANVKADKEALESVLKIMVPLREAWEQIFNSTNEATAPAAAMPYSPPPPPKNQKSFTAKC